MKILKGFVPSLNAKTSLGTNIIRSLAAQLGGEVNDDDVPESSPLRRGCSLQVRGETQGRRRSPLFARRFYIHPHASYNGRSRGLISARRSVN